MEHGNGNHDGDEAEDGRGEDADLDEEDDLSDDDDMSAVEDDNDNDDDLMLIERNDPGLLIFVIGMGYNPSLGWEVLGESIGRNTILNEVNIGDNEPQSELGPRFFRGLAKNRSIKKLSFSCSNRLCGENFQYLIPFFMNNKSLESLEIRYPECSVLPSEGRFDSLEFALEQFNGLKELTLASDDVIEGADKVIKALSGHTGLRKLSLEDVKIGREGFANLAAMLLNPSCSLSTLSLNSNFDDEIANILSLGLNGNVTLTELDLAGSEELCTEIGWKAIFDPLKSSTCMIHTLDLSHNYISDTSLPFLVSALSNNIKDLKVCRMENSDAILQAVFQFLQSPSCIIQSMDLSGNSFDDEIMESLTNALTNNCRLKELKIRWIRSVTPVGWHTLFQFLYHPSCGLESLNIGFNDLPDEIVESLAIAISNGSSLKELDLTHNIDVSPAAWQVLIIALRFHAPALEMFGMSTVHSGLTVLLADFLTVNHKLKILRIIEMSNNSSDSAEYVAAFTRVVFDTSSILNTYNSNHIIEDIGYDESLDRLPTHLSSLLRINKENTSYQAARIKIIKAHFSGSNINTQVFNHLELNVHPIAIAWMGGSKTNDLLFAFLRNVPLVCDTKSNIKKRKMVDEV